MNKTKDINWSMVTMTISTIAVNAIYIMAHAIILHITGEKELAFVIALALVGIITFAFIFTFVDAFSAIVITFSLLFIFADISVAGAFIAGISVAGALISAFTLGDVSVTEEQSFSFWKIFVFSILLIGALGIGDFFFMKEPKIYYGSSILILSALIACTILGCDCLKQQQEKKSIFAKSEKKITEECT